MNWFRCLSQVAPSRPTEYSQIGHRVPEQTDFNDCEEYLWIWRNGRLEYEEADGMRTHDEIWDSNTIFHSYSGRYDDCTNRISLGIPDKLQNRSVPNSLINQLSKIFSPDAEIWSFQSSSPGNPRGSGVQRLATKRKT